jgi:hypothetical protein
MTARPSHTPMSPGCALAHGQWQWRQSPVSAASPASIAARTGGSSFPSASVVAAATRCPHSASTAAAASRAAANCRAGSSRSPPMAASSHLAQAVARALRQASAFHPGGMALGWKTGMSSGRPGGARDLDLQTPDGCTAWLQAMSPALPGIIAIRAGLHRVPEHSSWPLSAATGACRRRCQGAIFRLAAAENRARAAAEGGQRRVPAERPRWLLAGAAARTARACDRAQRRPRRGWLSSPGA